MPELFVLEPELVEQLRDDPLVFVVHREHSFDTLNLHAACLCESLAV